MGPSPSRLSSGVTNLQLGQEGGDHRGSLQRVRQVLPQGHPRSLLQPQVRQDPGGHDPGGCHKGMCCMN